MGSSALLKTYPHMTRTNIYLMIAGIIAFIAFVIVSSQDWAGWLLAISLIPLTLWYGARSRQVSILATLLFILFCHQATIIYIAYFSQMSLISPDSYSFHKTALEIAENGSFGFLGTLYRPFLGLMYCVNPSQFFGQELSLLAFMISCFILIEICEVLQLPSKALPLIVFGMLPQNLIYGSIILREAWEILLIMLAILFALKWMQQKDIKHHLLLSLFFSTLCGFLHYGFLLYTPILLILAFTWPISFNTLRQPYVIISLMVVLLAMPFLYKYALMYEITNTHSQDALKLYSRFHHIMPTSNTSYMTNTSINSYFGLAQYVVKGFIYFLFGPFPWDVKSMSLFGVFLNTLLRIFFIVSSYRLLKILKRDDISFLFVNFFVLSFIWSLGCLNYGTAIRHQTTTDWIVVLLGASGFLLSFARKRKHDRTTYHD